MSEESLKRTQIFFKEKYGQEITEEEAKEINRRITTYFRLLARWKRQEDEENIDSRRVSLHREEKKWTW